MISVSDTGTVITGEEDIGLYALYSARAVLKLHLLGIRTRHVTPGSIAKRFGLTARTAKKLLPQIEGLIDKHLEDWQAVDKRLADMEEKRHERL